MARRRSPADGNLPPTMAEGPVGAGVATPPAAGKKRGRRRSFREGDLVAGRYRIVRFIAEGGMGEVFEARDLELDTPIALKTIRREHMKDATVVARFKREIQLARQVTHRNVCRIFDLERQDAAGEAARPLTDDSTSGDGLFLTMELLRGETLAARLQREGPMTPEQATPLVEQMAAALGAAHSVGVVHRDFKTGNVMLEPGEDGETRVVVTDFGIARSLDAEVSAETIAGGGGFVGTPAYMAPEQVQGLEVGPAADQYSLGVVIFEMLTGKVPFQGTTPLALAVSRLTMPPPRPREVLPDLPLAWEETLLRCLSRQPEQRFPSVTDVPLALAGRGHRPSRLPRTAVAALGVLLLAAVLAGGWAWLRRGSAGTTAAGGAAPARRSVAVLGFQSLSGQPDTAWLGTALSQVMGMELAAGESLRLVPDDAVARMKRELALASPGSVGPATLHRIRDNLGTDLVATGSFLAVPGSDQLRFDLRLLDSESGDTVATVSRSGKQGDLLALVSSAGGELRRDLGLAAAATTAAVSAAMPADPALARLYAEGVAAQQRFDPLAARASLAEAVRRAPRFALAHAALARVLVDLGREREAREQAKAAFENAAGLPREERYLIEARYREVTNDWGAAVDIYRRLFGFFPDNPEYGLALGEAWIRAGQPAQSREVLTQLRRLPAPVAGDPRVELLAGDIADAQGNYAALRDATEAAAVAARRRGAALLEAEALSTQAWAYVFLGDPKRGLADVTRAREIYAALDQQPGLADAMTAMGSILSMQGHHAQASDLERQAAAIQRRMGNELALAQALQNVTYDHCNMGDARGARAALVEARAAAAQLEADPTVMDLDKYFGGWLAFLEGKLDEAERLDRELITSFGKRGDSRRLAQSHRRLGEVLYARGDTAAALHELQEAVRLPTEQHLAWYVAQNQVPLAVAELAAGQAPTATLQARQALATFQQVGSIDRAAEANAVLALALAAQGKIDEARPAARAALGPWGEIESVRVRSKVALALAATSEPEAGARAREALDRAQQQGSIEAGFEARLALAHGNAAGLAALAADARKAGFGQIASAASGR